MENFSEIFEKETKETISAFRSEISKIRGSRPTPAIVEDIRADYFGQKLMLKQLGSIKVVPPREIDVSLWDKNSVSAVTKAIESANIGVSVQPDGNVVRVFLPELSQERRQETIRQAGKIAEEFRIHLRHQRDEVNKKIKLAQDNKEAGEDVIFRLKEKIQETTEEGNKEIDNILNNKIRELE